ncbi:hypothetical protein NEOKW01_1339 [Nematocida sp. AWRm80]|nr:hypothetical protein NEOKW01_1339 [Nematocida sp. AWRm80]
MKFILYIQVLIIVVYTQLHRQSTMPKETKDAGTLSNPQISHLPILGQYVLFFNSPIPNTDGLKNSAQNIEKADKRSSKTKNTQWTDITQYNGDARYLFAYNNDMPHTSNEPNNFTFYKIVSSMLYLKEIDTYINRHEKYIIIDLDSIYNHLQDSTKIAALQTWLNTYKAYILCARYISIKTNYHRYQSILKLIVNIFDVTIIWCPINTLYSIQTKIHVNQMVEEFNSIKSDAFMFISRAKLDENREIILFYNIDIESVNNIKQIVGHKTVVGLYVSSAITHSSLDAVLTGMPHITLLEIIILKPLFNQVFIELSVTEWLTKTTAQNSLNIKESIANPDNPGIERKNALSNSIGYDYFQPVAYLSFLNKIYTPDEICNIHSTIEQINHKVELLYSSWLLLIYSQLKLSITASVLSIFPILKIGTQMIRICNSLDYIKTIFLFNKEAPSFKSCNIKQLVIYAYDSEYTTIKDWLDSNLLKSICHSYFCNIKFLLIYFCKDIFSIYDTEFLNKEPSSQNSYPLKSLLYARNNTGAFIDITPF